VNVSERVKRERGYSRSCGASARTGRPRSSNSYATFWATTLQIPASRPSWSGEAARRQTTWPRSGALARSSRQEVEKDHRLAESRVKALTGVTSIKLYICNLNRKRPESTGSGGTRIRTGDTMIFSHMPKVIPMRVCRIGKRISVHRVSSDIA
jgi:hypothetical protein